jgi:hypothetical protein
LLFLFLTAFLLPSLARSSLAQSGNGTYLPVSEWGIWGAGSFHNAEIASRMDDSTLGMLGISYARTAIKTKFIALQYAVDAIPLSFLSYPRNIRRTPDDVYARTYAVGFNPLGLRFIFRPRHRIQPFAALRGGCLYFADKVPGTSGTNFNFTADLGGGLRIVSRSGKAFSVGYIFHHLSNADRGNINPGFDFGMIYVGYSFFR